MDHPYLKRLAVFILVLLAATAQATPTFRAAASKSASSTLPLTVSAPSGIATDDLEILIAVCPDANTISISTNGGGAWSAMTGTPITVASGMKLYIWWRQRGSGDTDPAVNGGGASPYIHATRLCYQAGTWDTTDPFEVETTGTETTSDTSFSFAAGVSTTVNNSLVCVVSTILRDSNLQSVPVCTNANLTSLASRYDQCTNVAAGGGFGMTEGTLATAGAVGTFANTYGAASPKSMIVFAIKPNSSSIKTVDGLAKASVKTAMGLAIASVKTIMGLP
jgi:hypothetical protein